MLTVVCFGRKRGAKTAMALALQVPDKIADFVAVDNAPVDALLSTDFPSYIRAMQMVDRSHVTKLAEADMILQQVEKVGVLSTIPGDMQPI